MFLENKLLVNSATTSGASRKKVVLKLPFLLNFKHKKLSIRFKNFAGRNRSGGITVFSKGSILKKSVSVVRNRFFRDNSILFISNFTINPITKSLSSLVYTSSGLISYLPSTTNHQLFNITYLSSLFRKKSSLFSDVLLLKRFAAINPTFFIIRGLPKNNFVSNLELQPLKGIQYSMSPGVKSTILKMDTRTGAALIRLPSGVRKVFSIYSLGSLGRPALKENNLINVTSAGYKKSLGFKPQTRGVAKNPVDHPHGGRTKAIKYPRTPWGKTTKYK